MAVVVDEYGSIEGIAGGPPEPGEAAEVGVRDLRDRGNFDTLARFVLHGIGHIPAPGEWFEQEGARFEAVDMDGRRIDKVLVAPLGEPGRLPSQVPQKVR